MSFRDWINFYAKRREKLIKGVYPNLFVHESNGQREIGGVEEINRTPVKIGPENVEMARVDHCRNKRQICLHRIGTFITKLSKLTYTLK